MDGEYLVGMVKDLEKRLRRLEDRFSEVPASYVTFRGEIWKLVSEGVADGKAYCDIERGTGHDRLQTVAWASECTRVEDVEEAPRFDERNGKRKR